MRQMYLQKPFLVFASVAVAALVVGAHPISIGQDSAAAKGRLPAYYGDIVTDVQRYKIYGIQEKYGKQISDLQRQLDTATKSRNDEIESVLNAEQKEKLKKAREEGAAKRKKAAANKKAAEAAKSK